jgi:hypothetical protein
VVKLRNARAVNLDVTALTIGDSAVTATADELNLLSGITDANINRLTEFEADAWAVQAAEATFTETAGAGVYTGSVSVPAGATLLDIIVSGVALWDNAGDATMIVGDADNDDGYYAGIDLKATDLLAGESISFALAGGKAGAYIANSQVSPRYAATARVISGIVTTTSTGGTAGRTRMTVVFAAPGSTVAAVKA